MWLFLLLTSAIGLPARSQVSTKNDKTLELNKPFAQEVPSPECSRNCSVLQVTTRAGELVELVGTLEEVQVEEVVAARVVGTGCFMVYEARHFRGNSFLVEPSQDELTLAAQLPWSAVRCGDLACCLAED